jgi:SulP family sulfate permease
LNKRLEPKLFSILRKGYPRQQLISDITAGVIVGVVALPLAIAFAIASGVKPEQGLFTAIIAGIVVSAFGGSRVQIAGPTGAFIVIVYGIVQKYGYDGLAVATVIAGCILIIMGVAKLGTLLRFVPYPLTVGFTSGIAVIIFSSQLKDFFGLRIGNLPVGVVEQWGMYAEGIGALDITAFAIGAVSLLIILLWSRVTHRVPGSLVAILGVTAIVHVFSLPVETVGTRFGSVPNMLPVPKLPDVSWQMIIALFSPAVTIALLGGIESLLSAVVADGMQYSVAAVCRDPCNRSHCTYGHQCEERREDSCCRHCSCACPAADHALLRAVGNTDPHAHALGDPDRCRVQHE